MIHLYIGKENLPKDKKFIYDVEPYFYNVPLTGTHVQREAIRLIDKGSYLDMKYFTDRFGGRTKLSELSTGTKAIFELEGLPDCVINCSECGDNALEFISMIPNCSVFLTERTAGLPWVEENPIMFEGRVWDSIAALNQLLG